REAAAALGAQVVEKTWHELDERGHLRSHRREQILTPLLNVNIPRGDEWQVMSTRLGRRLYADDVIYRRDPRRREYLWIGGSEVKHDRVRGTDTDAWEEGHASVTPLTLELFAHHHAELASAVAAKLHCDE